MKLNTLNTLIDDIMLELRQNNISESESVNRNQIEQWIVQYRAVLIKQDIDKGRDINQGYIQTINNLDLIVSKVIDMGSYSIYELKSASSIPKLVDFHFKSALTSVEDMAGNEIQMMSEKRSTIQRARRYTSRDYTGFLKENFLYVNGPMLIKKVNVRGIFENPYDVPGFISMDDEYPIPANMIPALKELIFAKEFKFQLPVDNINNSKNDIENANATK